MFYDIVFFLSPAAVAAGAKVSLVAGKYVITKAPATTIQAINGGLPPVDQSVQVTALIAQVAGLNGQVATLTADLATCQAALTDCLNGPPPPAQTIDSFTATPNPVTAGQPVTVAWATSNATVTLDGVAVAASGSLVSSPAANQTFTLVATGSAAPITQTVDVVVQAIIPPSPSPVINLQPFTGVMVGGQATLDALAFWRYTTFNRYERMESLTTLPQSGGALRMISVKMFNGAAVPLTNASITVTMTPLTGAPIVLPTVVKTGSDFSIPTPTLAPGWYRLTATAPLPVPAHWVYVPGGTLPTMMPVERANWEMEHPPGGGTTFTAADCVVPAVFAPTVLPYPVRVFEETTAIPSRATCVETQLVPCRAPDTYRIAYASTTAQQPEGGAYIARPAGEVGLATSAGRQPYNYFDLIGRELPMHPLLSGPRGQGTVFCAQHLWLGRNAKCYFTDNWSMGHIKADGKVTRLVGWEDDTPTLWTDLPRNLKLIGDWSAVAGAKSINRCWGFAFDVRTTVSDVNAPPVNGVQPHVGIGPVIFLVDYNHNRILRLQFNGGGVAAIPIFGNQDASAPCKVTEWKASANPFECVTDGTNRLFVSERAGNRIAVYSMDDASLIASWAMPAAYPYCEGLFYQDAALTYACVSADTFGQLTGGQIRRRTDGGADSLLIQLTTPWVIDNNSRFAKIALSDGTFGPRGMLSLDTWSGNGYGYPLLFQPNGTRIADSIFPGQANAGPGLPWQIGSGYPSATAFGQGRMVHSIMQEGIRVISKAQAGDVNLATAGYLAGRDDYKRRGFNLSNGDDGWGLYGLPQRWGVTPQIDEYLRAQGHV